MINDNIQSLRLVIVSPVYHNALWLPMKCLIQCPVTHKMTFKSEVGKSLSNLIGCYKKQDLHGTESLSDEAPTDIYVESATNHSSYH